jgi:hypothetical protein
MSNVKDKYRNTEKYAGVYKELTTAARYRGTLRYQEIAQIMGLPLTGNYMQREIGQILAEISEDEVINGRPMLSAIAEGVTGKLGHRFFDLARELGRLAPEEEEDCFLEKERQALYEVWKMELKNNH